MNVQQFLSEWDKIRNNVGLPNLAEQLGVLTQWVIIRKDQAVQEAKNKWWTGIIQSLLGTIKGELKKQDSPEAKAVSEMISKIEEAMEQHRKLHGNSEDADN